MENLPEKYSEKILDRVEVRLGESNPEDDVKLFFDGMPHPMPIYEKLIQVRRRVTDLLNEIDTCEELDKQNIAESDRMMERASEVRKDGKERGVDVSILVKMHESKGHTLMAQARACRRKIEQAAHELEYIRLLMQ